MAVTAADLGKIKNEVMRHAALNGAAAINGKPAPFARADDGQ